MPGVGQLNWIRLHFVRVGTRSVTLYPGVRIQQPFTLFTLTPKLSFPQRSPKPVSAEGFQRRTLKPILTSPLAPGFDLNGIGRGEKNTTTCRCQCLHLRYHVRVAWGPTMCTVRFKPIHLKKMDFVGIPSGRRARVLPLGVRVLFVLSEFISR